MCVCIPEMDDIDSRDLLRCPRNQHLDHSWSCAGSSVLLGNRHIYTIQGKTITYTKGLPTIARLQWTANPIHVYHFKTGVLKYHAITMVSLYCLTLMQVCLHYSLIILINHDWISSWNQPVLSDEGSYSYSTWCMWWGSNSCLTVIQRKRIIEWSFIDHGLFERMQNDSI